jgi:hypothetical protein
MIKNELTLGGIGEEQPQARVFTCQLQMHLINTIEGKFCCFLHANINLEPRLLLTISKNAASYQFLEFLRASSLLFSEFSFHLRNHLYRIECWPLSCTNKHMHFASIQFSLIGHLDSDIDFHISTIFRFDKITFRRSEDTNNSVKETSSAKVQVLIFEIEDREMIGGSAYGGQKAICCTSDLAKLGACTEGSVIYRPSQVNPGWPKLFVASFDGSDLIATLPSRTIPITKTGIYNMYFIHCDPSLASLEIEGKTIWKNPTGYLPGRMAPLKNFFGLMSFAFVVLGIYWFYQYMKSWREVLPLQNCITLVITLGMFEMALWYFEYAEFNETGVRPKGITFWAVTFGTVKRTAAEVIVLIVSMGYGVVTPTLGGLTSKVVMLGGTFFLATEILELVENLGAVNDLSGKARLFLVYPVAILDAAFVIWIFISLAKTIGKLQVGKTSSLYPY